MICSTKKTLPLYKLIKFTSTRRVSWKSKQTPFMLNASYLTMKKKHVLSKLRKHQTLKKGLMIWLMKILKFSPATRFSLTSNCKISKRFCSRTSILERSIPKVHQWSRLKNHEFSSTSHSLCLMQLESRMKNSWFRLRSWIPNTDKRKIWKVKASFCQMNKRVTHKKKLSMWKMS